MEREDRLRLKLKYTLLVVGVFALYMFITVAIMINSNFFWEYYHKVQEPYLLMGNGVTVGKIIFHTVVVVLTLILSVTIWFMLFVLLRFMVLTIQAYMLRKKLSKDEVREFSEWDLSRKLPFYQKIISGMISRITEMK